MSDDGKYGVTRAEFEAACAALPDGISWGDCISPATVLHILASRPAEVAVDLDVVMERPAFFEFPLDAICITCGDRREDHKDHRDCVGTGAATTFEAADDDIAALAAKGA